MADNVTIPATGTGSATPSIATDDVGGQHYQRMKLTDGVADSSTHLNVVAEDAALAGGEAGILAMGQRKDTPTSTAGTDGDATHPLFGANGGQWVNPLCKQVTVSTDLTRAANATAYAANDAMADTTAPAGGLTFTGCARVSGGSGIITDAIITTGDDPATPLTGEMFIFDTAPGTTPADNAVFAVADADIKTLVAVIPFAMTDMGNNQGCHVQNLNVGFTTVGSANLRFLVRVKNAYTPPGNSGVYTSRLKILQTD